MSQDEVSRFLWGERAMWMEEKEEGQREGDPDEDSEERKSGEGRGFEGCSLQPGGMWLFNHWKGP